MTIGALKSYRRIVVKIGSALLVDRAQGLKQQWLESLGTDVAALQAEGVEVLVVSSGAVALGRTVLGLPAGTLKLEESQASAAAGQIALAKAYADVLGAHQIRAGQVLLTLSDTEERRRYLNARATIETLLKLKAVPIINENDTVATNEIRYGDNDRLAARVATMIGADLLILLSDIDGLYTAPPHKDPNAQFLPVVEAITSDIEAMAGAAASELSRGGMKTKLDAGKIANAAGTAMIITSGTRMNPLAAIDRGERSTLFKASNAPVNAWKVWISGHLDAVGQLVIDDGALKALKSGKSLLPAGVREVRGDFQRGDTVSILNLEGREVARGLAGYDAADAVKIAGHKSGEIEDILGYFARSSMVHRNDLVIRGTRLQGVTASEGEMCDAG